MGEVENAHHARDDVESQYHEDDDGPEGQNFDGGGLSALSMPRGLQGTSGCRGRTARGGLQGLIGAYIFSNCPTLSRVSDALDCGSPKCLQEQTLSWPPRAC